MTSFVRRAVVAALFASVLAGCQGIYFDGQNDLPDDRTSADSKLNAFTPQQVYAALGSKDFLLIDVHTPYEGKLPGTDASIPYTQVDSIAAFIGANLDTHVVLTCKTDAMSIAAGNALIARGYRAVGYLAGGMTAWVGAGYDLAQ